MKLISRWIVTSIALVVAAWALPGIQIQESNAWVAVAVMAVILGLVNAIIRPLLKFMSCGVIILTMGLFIFVINAVTLWLSSYIAVELFDIGFVVDGFGNAFLGSIIVSVVSFLLSIFIKDDDDD
jgi:putative membrane protein